MSEQQQGQTPVVEEALRTPLIHPRLIDQGITAESDLVRGLNQVIPPLRPFGGNRYESVRVILDWDHKIPVEIITVRIYACYSNIEQRRLETQVRGRQQTIDADNLYPEFDLPDFGELDASEAYAAAFRPGELVPAEMRFFSPWRRDVRPAIARAAVGAVKQLESYKNAYRRRNNESLGPAVAVGWAPPCVAQSDAWSIEVWLLTEFDGQSGRAMVFMVDGETFAVSREYFTEVHLA